MLKIVLGLLLLAALTILLIGVPPLALVFLGAFGAVVGGTWMLKPGSNRQER